MPATGVKLHARRDGLRREGEQFRPILLAVLAGIAGALANIVFRIAIEGSTRLFQETIAAPFDRAGIPLGLLAGGLALLLLDRVFPGEVLGYGFPRFLESLHLQGGRVKRRWMIVKTLGAAISLGAGASVGREGPIAQIAGAAGTAIARLGRVSEERRKVLIACGAAAGIAATFNAPIGALMFAHEIILLGELHLTNFMLVVVATSTSVVVSHALLPSTSVFVVQTFVLESYWECLTYGLLGIVLGCLGACYTRVFHFAATSLRRLEIPRAALLLGDLFIVGVIAVAFPQNVSDGYGTINQALAGELSWQLMAMLALAKIVSSSISLGCGAPGGVFGPIFFIGAMTGGSFRAVSELMLPGLTGPLGSYTLVGLGAFLAATTHAPLTALFLLFEMTDTRSVAIPALISIVVSLMISTRLEPDSIDTLGLTAEGKSLHPPTDLDMIERMPVETVYRRSFESVRDDTPRTELLRLVRASRSSTLPVLNASGELVGLLSFTNLRALLLDENGLSAPERTAKDICDPTPVTLKPRDELGTAFRRMDAEGLDDVPVVESSGTPRLLGMISRADVIAAYNRAVATLGATQVPFWLKRVEPGASEREGVVSLPVPPHWIGLTITQLEARMKGVALLAIHTRTSGYETPDKGRMLRSGDILVLAGTSEALRAAQTA